MVVLLAALVVQHPLWWSDFEREYKRCGLVFYVEGNPGGDGVFIEKDYSGLLLDSGRTRPQKPIRCIARWAKKHGLKVRYKHLSE